MDGPAGEVTARVTAMAPLLRRGLVRAAVAAGFTVVASDAVAQVTIGLGERGEDPRAAAVGVQVDVLVGVGAVVLTVRHAPDVATALKLRGLLIELLEAPTATQG
jgi:hypothetical protein